MIGCCRQCERSTAQWHLKDGSTFVSFCNNRLRWKGFFFHFAVGVEDHHLLGVIWRA